MLLFHIKTHIFLNVENNLNKDQKQISIKITLV